MRVTFSQVFPFQHIASLNQKGVLGGGVEFLELRQSSHLPTWVHVHRGGLSLPSLALFGV